VKYERIRGRPFGAHGFRFVPWTERVRWRLPGGRGGLVWSRALAIEVEKEGRDLGHWRVRDRTRQVECFFLAAGVVGFLAALSMRRR
jgi:hypothetical protein